MNRFSYILITGVFLTSCVQPTQQQATRVSALPAAVTADANSNCAIPDDESTFRGYEPSLNAWATTADSVFVGTISKVERVIGPVHLIGMEGGAHDLGVIENTAQCEFVRSAVRISFDDVRTLRGKTLDDSLVIQMGMEAASVYPGVYFEDGSDELIDTDGRPVYQVGSRVGGALFEDSTGKYHLNYQQFEVEQSRVYLQALDDASVRTCNTVPHVLAIPSAYDGVDLDTFLAAITDTDTQLTADEALSVQTWHDNWRRTIESTAFQLTSQPYCNPTPGEPPAEGDRTPEE